MTWIKICGITNLEDALAAVKAGADALGFVFFEKSPRRIDPRAVQQIVAKLPPKVEKIGVFVDSTIAHIRQTVQQAELTGVQVHGNEDISFFDRLADGWNVPESIRFVRALSVRPGFETLAGTLQSGVNTFLLDSPSAERRGGTGASFDWPRAAEFVKRHQTIVAGGLTPANVKDAIRILNPWGVDVSSGVEAQPGKKDPEKIRAFIAAVRSAEHRP